MPERLHEAAATTDSPDMDPVLAHWLRSGPAACPRCRYDLSAAQRPRCPECGFTLALRVGVADPATVPWTLVFMLLALSPGLAGMVFLVDSVLGTDPALGPHPHDPLLRAGLLSTFPLLAWIIVHRWYPRLGRARRRVLIAAFILIALIGARMTTGALLP